MHLLDEPALIEAHGAVSEVVARAMAFGAVRHSRARVSVAVTGVAGPTGGSFSFGTGSELKTTATSMAQPAAVSSAHACM